MSIRIADKDKFERDLKKFADKLEININTAVKKVAFDVYKGVTEKTPVDTGYARESWNISPHHPNPSVENKKKYTKKSDIPQGEMSSRNYDKQRIADKKKEVERWFITNNVPYIISLEAGHSQQSSHMVTRTLNEVQANVGILLKEIK